MEKSNGYLTNFENIISNNIDKDDLSNFYRNIKTLVFKIKAFNPNVSFWTTVTGNYDSKKNKINVYEASDDIIYHELLHMASSFYQKGIWREGFFLRDSNVKSLGVGLNEGYTELLARRLFNIDSKVCNGYEYQVYIVRLLERIIGKDYMQRYYFNANLPGLIDDLSQYNSQEDIIKFLHNTDYILNVLDKAAVFRKNQVCSILTKINEFLSKTYMKKMYLEYQAGTISRKNMLTKIALFNNQLIDDSEKEDEYTITNVEDTSNYMSQVINDRSLVNEYKLIKVKQ